MENKIYLYESFFEEKEKEVAALAGGIAFLIMNAAISTPSTKSGNPESPCTSVRYTMRYMLMSV